MQVKIDLIVISTQTQGTLSLKLGSYPVGSRIGAMGFKDFVFVEEVFSGDVAGVVVTALEKLTAALRGRR